MRGAGSSTAPLARRRDRRIFLPSTTTKAMHPLATLTMLRMLRARNLRIVISAITFLVSIFAARPSPAQSQDQAQRIDLTRDRLPNEETYRYPGGSSDSYNPDSPLPLPLSVQGFEISEIDVDHYVIGLKLTNRGAVPFQVPSSLNMREVEADGNRRRRTILFVLDLKDSSTNTSQLVPIQSADCSDSLPKSYVVLNPGQTVTILLPLQGHALWKLRSAQRPKIRLRITEWLLSDTAFFVAATSKPLFSSELTCSNGLASLTCH